MTTASVARMVWGSPSVTPTTPTTPTAAVTPTAPTTTPTTNMATTNMATAPTTSTGMLGFSTEMPTGYRQQDLGDGSYEVFNANNESMGVGFKSVQDALRERGFANAWRTTSNDNGVWTNPNLTIAQDIWRDVNGNEVDVSGMEQVEIQNDSGPMTGFMSDGILNMYQRGTKQVNRQFNSEDEIRAAVNGLLGQRNYNGVMGDWEAIGQVLNGAISPQPQNWGNLPTNQRDEVISGTGMLYGSTPVYGSDGRIIGYRTDLTPNNDAQDFSNGTDTINQEAFGTFIRHDGRSHDWNNANWRELNDPEAWRRNAIVGEGGNAFIPVENLNNLSWTNRDSYQHQDTRANWGFSDIMGDIAKYTDPIFYHSIGGEDFYETAGQEGIYAAVFDRLDPILDKIDPGHNGTQNAIKNAIGADSQRDAFQRIAPIMVAIFAPYGAAINAANSAQQGNYAAAATAVAGQLLSGVDFGSAAANAGASSTLVNAVRAVSSGNIATMTGGLVDFGSTAINQIIGRSVLTAARNGVAAGLSGADLEDALKTALVSAAGSLVGGAVSNAASNNGVSQNTSNVIGAAAGSITSNAINSATAQGQGDSTDSPSAPSPGSATTTTQAPQSTTVQPLAGRVARMVWR